MIFEAVKLWSFKLWFLKLEFWKLSRNYALPWKIYSCPLYELIGVLKATFISQNLNIINWHLRLQEEPSSLFNCSKSQGHFCDGAILAGRWNYIASSLISLYLRIMTRHRGASWLVTIFILERRRIITMATSIWEMTRCISPLWMRMETHVLS